jgi:hypothetical protein
VATGREVFRKIANSRASGGGNQIKDGKYEFTVTKLLMEDKYTGCCFIAELLVDKAEASEPNIEPNAVGSTCSYVVNLDGSGKLSAPGNIKAFVLALLGLKEDEVSADEVADYTEKLVASDQPGRGMKITDETYRKTIRGGANAGKPFTAHRWGHVAGQTEASVAARKAELDASK